VTDDHDDPDRPARTAEPVRVARFELLEGDADRETRVATFDGLEATEAGRPLAPAIRLDSIATLRSPGSRRSSDDRAAPGPPEPDHGEDVPLRNRGQGATASRSRPSRRSGEADAPADARSASEAAVRDEVVDDGIPPDAIPPDGPLPRGRRRRARTGRLGPDAPDPELSVPEADPVAIAREICLRLLTDRARTRQELAQALARKGVPDGAAAEVLDRFADVGLVDDAAFAGQWVRSRHTYRGLGRRAIAVELRRKGVPDGVAKEALAEVDTEAEDRRARELIDRKLRSMAVDTADQRATAARRLVGMLARKGYGAGTAYRVVREALAEQGADADELGPGADLDG
jgi:regulatory protein